MFYKRRKVRCPYLAVFSIIALLLFSCSPQYTELKKQKKIEKKQKKDTKKEEKKNRVNEQNSKSEFKAYYNSYYLAKIKFKDALEELLYSQNRNESSNRNNNSTKLFDDAIKYSDIVLDNFVSEIHGHIKELEGTNITNKDKFYNFYVNRASSNTPFIIFVAYVEKEK